MAKIGVVRSRLIYSSCFVYRKFLYLSASLTARFSAGIKEKFVGRGLRRKDSRIHECFVIPAVL
jgi:hypothetical protein